MRKLRPFLLALAVAVTAVAGPTTTPATKPAVKHAPAAPPKDWVRSENTAAHYEFYTPKKWDGSGATGQKATFNFPAPEKKGVENPNAPHLDSLKLPVFTVESNKSTGGTLEAEADLYRKSLATDQPGYKIDSDAAAPLGDRGGWLFVTEENYKAGTQVIVGSKPEKTKDVMHKLKTWKLIAIDGDQLVSVTLSADSALFNPAQAMCKKPLDTFAWTNADEKK